MAPQAAHLCQVPPQKMAKLAQGLVHEEVPTSTSPLLQPSRVVKIGARCCSQGCSPGMNCLVGMGLRSDRVTQSPVFDPLFLAWPACDSPFCHWKLGSFKEKVSKESRCQPGCPHKTHCRSEMMMPARKQPNHSFTTLVIGKGFTS